MALHWSQKSLVIARVGEALAQRGWQLYGYHKDESDPMTDYYSPASWDGVATHPDFPGVVAGVGVSAYIAERGGKEETYSEALPGETCERCGGSGLDPLGWTLEAARKDPQRYHRERIEAEFGPESRARVLLHDVVSPIPFTSGEKMKCIKCAGRGHALRYEMHVRYVWPTFKATPKGRMWHVERGGQIITTGTGYERCWGYDQGAKDAVKAVCDAIEAAARRGNAQKQEAKPARSGAGAVQVTHDRDWTWIAFAEKPDEAVREALKAQGARFSGRRKAWYIREHVPEEEVLALVAGQ